MSRLIAVFDIDGTLANHSHRAALLRKRCNVCLHEPLPVGHHAPCPLCGSTMSTPTQESWDAFLEPDLMLQDPPIVAGVELVHRFRDLGAYIAFITGRREDAHGEVTRDWLRMYAGRLDGEPLIMRCHTEEDISASVYKERAINTLKAHIGEDGTYLFFEDDVHVFPVYDKHGIVIRCPHGLQHFSPPGPRYSEQTRNI